MIKFNTEQLAQSLIKTPTKAEVAIKMYATVGAQKLQNYAKVHARWTDRTGHARQRLVGFVETQKEKTKVCISHGVDYGIYLELCNEKKYAILNETVQQNSKEIVEGYQNLMDKIK